MNGIKQVNQRRLKLIIKELLKQIKVLQDGAEIIVEINGEPKFFTIYADKHGQTLYISVEEGEK